MIDLTDDKRPRMVLCIHCGFVFKHWPRPGEPVRLILPCAYCVLVEGRTL